MPSEYFSKTALKSTNRVLSLLDRNGFSKTFGCFDKYYWHFKTKDFPSASCQMGVEFLSRLWNLPHGGFYKNPTLLQWIKAGMEYTLSLQHGDGSFDEWYPNERGWAGPAGYIIHSLIKAYEITESQWDEDFRNRMKNCFLKAGRFLIRQKEGADLANHFALFLLVLYETGQVSGDQKIKAEFDSCFKKFKSFVSKEGWSMEYDNVDFGYNLAVLSFLGRLNKIYPNPFLKNHARKAFEFLSFFFYPDGSFGGLGSRETIHLYPFALTYWGRVLPVAKALHRHLMNKKSYEKLTPADQDDHYLFYRLSEYMEADEPEKELGRQSAKNSEKQPEKQTEKQTENFSAIPLLPFEKKPFKKYFPDCGFFVQKTASFYFVSNMKKGGALRIYDIPKGNLLLKNNGWIGQLKDKSKITNCRKQENDIIEITDKKITVQGKAVFLNQKYFNSLKFAAFRLTLSLAGNYKTAFYLKKIIRHFLILQKKQSKHSFKREIIFTESTQKTPEIHIVDFINCDRAERVFYGGGFSVRYVPQSGYFEDSDLQSPSEDIKIPPKNTKEFILKQTCLPLTSEIHRSDLKF